MLELDLDDLTKNHISELRILVQSPGWKLFQQILKTRRFAFYAQAISMEPEPGETPEMFALRISGEMKFQRGLIEAGELVNQLLEGYVETEDPDNVEERRESI